VEDLSLLDLHPKEIARQLTILHFGIFQKVHLSILLLIILLFLLLLLLLLLFLLLLLL